jgi:hypothetical protein
MMAGTRTEKITTIDGERSYATLTVSQAAILDAVRARGTRRYSGRSATAIMRLERLGLVTVTRQPSASSRGWWYTVTAAPQCNHGGAAECPVHGGACPLRPKPKLVPDWARHDNLCQARQSAGTMACDCSPACNCRACRDDRLAVALAELMRGYAGGDAARLDDAESRIMAALGSG